MAASYWESTQSKNWTFSKNQLAVIRKRFDDASPKLVASYPLPDRRLLHIYFWHRMLFYLYPSPGFSSPSTTVFSWP